MRTGRYVIISSTQLFALFDTILTLISRYTDVTNDISKCAVVFRHRPSINVIGNIFVYMLLHIKMSLVKSARFSCQGHFDDVNMKLLTDTCSP